MTETHINLLIASSLNVQNTVALKKAGFTVPDSIPQVAQKPSFLALHATVLKFHVMNVSLNADLSLEEAKQLHNLVQQFKKNLKFERPLFYKYLIAVTECWRREAKIKCQSDFDVVCKAFATNLERLEKECMDWKQKQ